MTCGWDSIRLRSDYKYMVYIKPFVSVHKTAVIWPRLVDVTLVQSTIESCLLG